MAEWNCSKNRLAIYTNKAVSSSATLLVPERPWTESEYEAKFLVHLSSTFLEILSAVSVSANYDGKS